MGCVIASFDTNLFYYLIFSSNFICSSAHLLVYADVKFWLPPLFNHNLTCL